MVAIGFGAVGGSGAWPACPHSEILDYTCPQDAFITSWRQLVRIRRFYRWKEHVGPYDDFHMGYRTEAEAQAWIDDDQLVKAGALLDDDTRLEINQEVEAEIQAAFEFAENSDFPDISELYDHVYMES